MKKEILLIFLAFATFSLSAQVLLINSPSSLEGAYQFEAAAFGADVTLDTVYTGDAVIADDGTGTTTDACEPLVNDVTNNFVLIDRGDCEFGVKCLGAETAGAQLVIMVNNVPGPAIVMGAGAVGGQVTIPCVMISIVDGMVLKDAINAGETINISFGGIQFDNDLGTDLTGISLPLLGSVPASQIAAMGSYPFVPGVGVTNKGANEAFGATVDASIEYTPDGGSSSVVYEESITAADAIASDSTEFLALPEFDLSEVGEGTYTINYEVSNDSLDQSDFDNAFSRDISITQDIFGKTPMNPDTGLPGQTNAFTVGGGGTIEFLTGYNIPNGSTHILDSVIFFVSTAAASLENITVNVLVYEWNDENANGTYDNDGGSGTHEFTLVGIGLVEFDPGAPANAWVSVAPFDLITDEFGITIGGDNKNYVIGTRYEGAETVFFGFNQDYDLTASFADGVGVITSDLQRPYLGTQTLVGSLPDVDMAFTFTDLQAPTSTVIRVRDLTVDTEEILPEGAASIDMFPNPTSDELTIKVALDELTTDFEYRISDFNGRLIQTIRKGQLQNDVSRLNVAQLPAGQYILTVVTDKGIATQTFVKQ